jgi:hypothetical protein
VRSQFLLIHGQKSLEGFIINVFQVDSDLFEFSFFNIVLGVLLLPKSCLQSLLDQGIICLINHIEQFCFPVVSQSCLLVTFSQVIPAQVEISQALVIGQDACDHQHVFWGECIETQVFELIILYEHLLQIWDVPLVQLGFD